MKKLFVLATALAALCGCQERNTFTDGQFIVGFDADFPPYGYKDGDTYKGFDLDLAREVCQRKGWTFVANPINWDAKDMELNSGSIDCIWNGFTMQGRENAYTWSAAYVDNSQVVLVKADAPIASLADLAGKVVGVQTDTPVQKALSKGGDKYETLGKTFKGLSEGATFSLNERTYKVLKLRKTASGPEVTVLDQTTMKEKIIR